jgi:hypothetical protein
MERGLELFGDERLDSLDGAQQLEGDLGIQLR